MEQSERVEFGGIVRISKQGAIVVPVELRDVLGIEGKDSYIRVDISAVEDGDDGKHTTPESAGIIKCSDEGIVTVPVELREMFGIKSETAYVRLHNISVARIVDDEDEGGESA